MTAKIKLNAASGGGSFSLQAPSSSSNNRVFTLPDSADATLLTSTASLGKILQQKFVKKTDSASTSSNSIVETSSDFRTTITPISASSTILVQAFLAIGSNASDVAVFRLARNTASDFSGTTTEFLTPSTYSPSNYQGNIVFWNSAGYMATVPLVAYETSGNTTARTYSPFWVVNAGTVYLNQYTSTTYTMTSVMTVTEIAA